VLFEVRDVTLMTLQSGGLHEKHAVTTWNLESISASIIRLPPSPLTGLISTPFSNTLSLYPSLDVRDRVSQPYKTKGKNIIVIYKGDYGAGIAQSV
jgi:hypothetical protein